MAGTTPTRAGSRRQGQGIGACPRLHIGVDRLLPASTRCSEHRDSKLARSSEPHQTRPAIAPSRGAGHTSNPAPSTPAPRPPVANRLPRLSNSSPGDALTARCCGASLPWRGCGGASSTPAPSPSPTGSENARPGTKRAARNNPSRSPPSTESRAAPDGGTLPRQQAPGGVFLAIPRLVASSSEGRRPMAPQGARPRPALDGFSRTNRTRRRVLKATAGVRGVARCPHR